MPTFLKGVTILLLGSALLLAMVPAVSAEMVDLTPGTFSDIVQNRDKNVLVLFYAAWCGHCQRLKPLYEELAEAYPLNGNVTIARIDASMHREIGTANGVNGFPTLKMFSKEDKSGVMFKGKRTVEALKKFVDAHST